MLAATRAARLHRHRLRRGRLRHSRRVMCTRMPSPGSTAAAEGRRIAMTITAKCQFLGSAYLWRRLPGWSQPGQRFIAQPPGQLCTCRSAALTSSQRSRLSSAGAGCPTAALLCHISLTAAARYGIWYGPSGSCCYLSLQSGRLGIIPFARQLQRRLAETKRCAGAALLLVL